MTPTSTETYSPQSYRTVFAVLFAGFVLAGIVGILNGPILPTFIARWSLDDATAGLFFTAMYLGSLGGTFVSSVLIAGKGYRTTLALGFGLIAVGIAALNLPSHRLAMAATVIYGAGYGLTTPGTNLWVAEYSGERRASALNLLNLAWGLGAMGCPALVFYAVRTQRYSLVLWGIAAGASVLVLLLLRSPFAAHAKSAESPSGGNNELTAGWWTAVGLGFLFFVYVGTENGISLWAATYAKRVMAAGDTSWTLAPMMFFLGLLGGRAVASVALLHVKETRVVYGGLLLAAAATLAFMQAKTRMALFATVTLAGLGCSSLYPVFVAWLAKWFGVKARSIGGVMFSLAALGGASIPWLVGFVSKHADSLRLALLVPVAGCISLFAVTALLRPGRRG